MSNRIVNTYRYKVINGRIQRENGNGCYIKEFVETGVFHGFGVNHEEYENGPGNFSVAIVEFSDGRVEGVPLELIKFVGEKDA